MSHHIAELVNIAPNPQQAYVGNSVFAHKGGLHASAVARSADLYEHVVPSSVGNGTRVVVSEMAGRSTLAMKAAELGLELDGEVLGRVLDELKRLEHEGYHFEVADGSLELLLRRATGWTADFFRVESFRVITDHGEQAEGTTSAPFGVTTEATVKVHVGDERIVATAEGNGPVNALDAALRAAIGPKFPVARLHPPDRLPGARARYGQGHGRGHPGPRRHHRRRSRSGPPSGCPRTSSRPAGRPSTTRSSTGFCTGPEPGHPIGSSRQPCTSLPTHDPADVCPHQRGGPGAAGPPSPRARGLDHLTPGRARRSTVALRGRGVGTPGPDAGFALRLAHRFAHDLKLADGETEHDVLLGCALIAARRAALFGRGPSIYDVQLALALWGFLVDAPPRTSWPPGGRAFSAVSHDYVAQRALVDAVPESSLRLTPAEAQAKLAAGENLVSVPGTPAVTA